MRNMTKNLLFTPIQNWQLTYTSIFNNIVSTSSTILCSGIVNQCATNAFPRCLNLQEKEFVGTCELKHKTHVEWWYRVNCNHYFGTNQWRLWRLWACAHMAQIRRYVIHKCASFANPNHYFKFVCSIRNTIKNDI